MELSQHHALVELELATETTKLQARIDELEQRAAGLQASREELCSQLRTLQQASRVYGKKLCDCL